MTTVAVNTDYSTFALAEAALNDSNDYSSSGPHTIQIEGDVTADAGGDVDGGTNQDGTNHLTIVGLVGDGHHGGVIGGGAKLISSSTTLKLSDPYVTVKGLEIENTETSTAFDYIFNITADNCLIDQCILKSGTGTNCAVIRYAGANTGLKVWRSLLIGGANTAAGGIFDTATNTGLTCQFLQNTVWDANAASYGTRNRKTWDTRNTVVAGFGTTDFGTNGGLWAAASTHNASSDTSASSVDATNYQNSITAANEFVDTSTNDFNIDTGTSTALLGNGTDLSSVFGDSYDITGSNTFSGSWDIGAYANSSGVTSTATIQGSGATIQASATVGSSLVSATADLLGTGAALSAVASINTVGVPGAGIQDNMKVKLLLALSLSTGALPDLWKAWLEANTVGTASTISGLENLFLTEEGIAAGPIDERWKAWLGAAPRSYTGSLNDRWDKYWRS